MNYSNSTTQRLIINIPINVRTGNETKLKIIPRIPSTVNSNFNNFL